MKNFISIFDCTKEDIFHLIDKANFYYKKGRQHKHNCLSGRHVGIHFLKTSTRTRLSFSVGAQKLGASIVSFGEGQLQTETGETLEDTAKVLSSYLDAIVMRTAGSIEKMRAYTCQKNMSVINAMSDVEHPTQAITDFAILQNKYKSLRGLHILYVGEGNNTAMALAAAAAVIGDLKITFITPEGYGLPLSYYERAKSVAQNTNTQIEEFHSTKNLPRKVDVVYTTRWQTTGTVKNDPTWREKFKPFAVTQDFFDSVAIPSRTTFMHDLPAVRGEEVESSLLEGKNSIAFEQASWKLWGAMAVLDFCIGKN